MDNDVRVCSQCGKAKYYWLFEKDGEQFGRCADCRPYTRTYPRRETNEERESRINIDAKSKS